MYDDELPSIARRRSRPAPFAPRARVYRSGERRRRTAPEGGHLRARDFVHRLQAREVRRERPMRVDRAELRTPPGPVQQASGKKNVTSYYIAFVVAGHFANSVCPFRASSTDREEDVRRGHRAGMQKQDVSLLDYACVQALLH